MNKTRYGYETYINSTFYDVVCYNITADSPHYAYADQALADQYIKELDIPNSCDHHCVQKGSQWSLVYTYGGFTAILGALVSLLVVLGSYFYKPRIIGLCLNCVMGLINIFGIAITAYYRFRTQGKLAALSTAPSRPMKVSTDEKASGWGYDTSVTYQDDANFIKNMLIVQCVVFVVVCVASNIGCFKNKEHQNHSMLL